MQQVYEERDQATLFSFLKRCQDVARQKKHFQIASISLKIKYIDPLAVLESIYEPSELHFYLEYPIEKEAIAGAEAIVSNTFSGPNRFKESKNFANKLLENTMTTGDLSDSLSGIRFFCSFTFFDDQESEQAPFPPATIFVPRWQVASKQGEYTAVTNMRIDPDSNLPLIAQKVWTAHQKFTEFNYNKRHPKRPSADGKYSIKEVGGPSWYKDAVTQAVSTIQAGEHQKIVLARAVDLEGEKPFDPLNSLNRLRKQYPDCFPCSVANDKGQSFIAAAPERLLKIERGLLLTEAVAGTIRRGETVNEDTQLSSALLANEKDLAEHRYVINFITEQLQSLGINPRTVDHPRLKKLANVQHLQSPITADMPESIHLLDILEQLHPTPAVGGAPLDKAMDYIKKIENFERGLYAGTLGWFDHKGDGEFVVAIRSALINNNSARVYTGGGIVAGSNPEQEREETDYKIQAIMNNLQ